MAVATPSHASPSPMNASGRRPWAASQLPAIRVTGLATGAAPRPGESLPREEGDPVAIGLFGALMAESAGLGFAEQMAGLAIGDGVQRPADRERLQGIQDSHQRLRWLEPARV